MYGAQRLRRSDDNLVQNERVPVKRGLAEIRLEVMPPCDGARGQVERVIGPRARTDIDELARDRGCDEDSTARVVTPEPFGLNHRGHVLPGENFWKANREHHSHRT